jgi:hypothetical protein
MESMERGEQGEDADLEALIGRIPACWSSTTPNLRCCCGRTDCAYLKHNCVALDDLEKEVRTAAQLGQVCNLLFTQTCASHVTISCSAPQGMTERHISPFTLDFGLGIW